MTLTIEQDIVVKVLRYLGTHYLSFEIVSGRLSTLAEKQINQDPPVAKENVLLMEIEMKRNS